VLVKLVRPGLGIDAFGANIMDLPPDTRRVHDEAQSGQQELTSLSAAPARSSSANSGCRSTPTIGLRRCGTDRVLASGRRPPRTVRRRRARGVYERAGVELRRIGYGAQARSHLFRCAPCGVALVTFDAAIVTLSGGNDVELLRC